MQLNILTIEQVKNWKVDREKIQAAMDQEPTLTYFGLGIYPGSDVETEKLRLLNAVEEVSRCVDWLSNAPYIKTINTRHTSYGLKHVMEHACGGYVSNGVFIAAVIILGIPYRKYNLSANISIAISQKYVKSQQNLPNLRG